MGSAQGDFVIAEWQDPGGPPEPPRFIVPLHTHYHDDEAWYVLEGSLCMTANIYRLIRDIHAMTERTPEKMKELFGRYNSYLLS